MGALGEGDEALVQVNGPLGLLPQGPDAGFPISVAGEEVEEGLHRTTHRSSFSLPTFTSSFMEALSARRKEGSETFSPSTLTAP